MSNNPLQDALSCWGVPWTTPTVELVERYGITQHPFLGSEGIQITDALEDLPGRMSPVFASANRPQSVLPLDYFSADVWVADDAKQNIAVAADYFATRLGQTEVLRYANTLRCAWTAGPASIQLMVWPPELQTLNAHNPSHEREPRLVQACMVGLHPGFRVPLSAQEQAWVESASAVLLRSRGAASGQVSLSADGRALVINGDELHVVPVADISRLTVSKLHPAKGPGGSWLDIVCADVVAEYGETRFRILSGSGPDDLDTDARRLGKLIKKPVEIDSAHPDA